MTRNPPKARRNGMARTGPAGILSAVGMPGLFITGTSTDIGKTTVTAALAGAFRRLNIRVGVCKPVASGCPRNPSHGKSKPASEDELFSPDAQLSAKMAGLELRDVALRNMISPIRYAAPVSPHLAAAIEGREPDWRRVADAITYWRANCDVLLVEGAGGWLVPLNDQLFMIADLAQILALPVVVVTGTYLGTLNHTALTVESIRSRKLQVAGLVANRVPKNIAASTHMHPDELERVTRAPLLAVLPERSGVPPTRIPQTFIDAMEPFARQWWNDCMT